MNETPTQPETITRLLDAVYPSFALLAGMELDLFTRLNDGPLTVRQLADVGGVQPVKLRPLLYTLVVAGLLTIEDNHFANTVEADHYLVRGKPAYLGGTWELTASNWSRILRTAGTIRAGGPLEEHNYHETSPEEQVALFRGLYPGAVADAASLMDHYDFSTRSTLLDVGGGSGGLAITIVQTHPHLKATVVDLPLVTPITRQFIAEANLTGRINVLTADAIHDALSGSYDVIVARHFLQVLSADDNRVLLSNLATIVNPGGVIHLVGWMLDDSRLSPPNTVGYNLVLLNAYQDGQAYTEQEHRDWLAEAGFVDFERVVRPDGVSIVTARKPN